MDPKTAVLGVFPEDYGHSFGYSKKMYSITKEMIVHFPHIN